MGDGVMAVVAEKGDEVGCVVLYKFKIATHVRSFFIT